VRFWPRDRRRQRWLLGILAGLAIGGWWVDRQLQPERLLPRVLARIGEQQGLRIAFSGEADYVLRPEPRLRLEGVSVAATGGEAWLRARRIDISLPWATLTGGEPVITRLELEAPDIDLAGYRRWQQSRPPEPFELPTLRSGLRLRDGTLRGEAWRLEQLELSFPHLAEGQPLEAEFAAVLRHPDLSLEGRGSLQLERAGLQSPYALDLQGRWLRDPAVPLRLQARGAFDARERIELQAAPFRLTAAEPLVGAEGELRLESGEGLKLALDTRLPRWPAHWPALPAPLDRETGPLAIGLDYAGPGDFAAPLRLVADYGPSRFEGELVLADFRAWQAAPPGDPLPPLRGRLLTPALEIEGIRLEGVDVEFGATEEPAG
jgi:hypothetical protein